MVIKFMELEQLVCYLKIMFLYSYRENSIEIILGLPYVYDDFFIDKRKIQRKRKLCQKRRTLRLINICHLDHPTYPHRYKCTHLLL